MNEGHWFGGGFMWLFWILLIMVILWIAIAATGNSSATSSKSASALEILKERYARGEIDLEEYENKKKHLAD